MSTLFDSLTKPADVEALISNAVRESEVLEYKTASTVFSDNDRKEIAKDVSGMANSLGGIIIYGVATDKKDKTLPVAIEPIDLKIIESIDQVINSQVRPPIPGLRKKMIPEMTPTIMILEIPPSEDPPHQNLYDKKYYRRSGTQCLPMEHDLVALKFGRRFSPILNISCQSVTAPNHPHGTPAWYQGEALVRVLLEATGRRVARHVQVVLLFPSIDFVRIGVRSGSAADISKLYPGRQANQFTDNSGVYHPGTIASIVEVGLTVSEALLRDHSKDPLIEWLLYADEMNTRTGIVTAADLGWHI